MSDERKDLPPVTAPNFLQRVRETLQIYLGSQGNALDRGLTVRDLADANVIKVNDAYLAGGNVNPVGGAGPAAGASTVVNNYTTTISYEPDLTKPPSPTGFTASAGLSYIYFQTDTPAFTAGHGFGQLRLYGAKYVSGALPTFSSAVELTREVAPLGSYPSSTGTNWRLWVTWVSKDGVESDPTGGTNGVSVTTGKIGNADLNSAIIEAANLASGAIDASKFTSTIEPVTLVTSVPGTKQTSTIFNTTDGKLYRWNGTAYVASVLTSDLSGTVTGSQIAANTITAGNLAAGSVTASKMFITGAGAALNADPNGTDATAWNGSPVMLTGLTDVPFGSTAIANAVGSSKDVLSAELIPVEQAKRYRIEALVKQVAGSGGMLYLGVAWYDATGSLLVSGSAQPSGAGSPAGWANGTYSYFGLIGAAAPGTWTRYVTSFGSGETCAIPSNAKFMRILALLNYSSSGGVQHAVTGFKVMEKADADLIVDGSIIASKLAANAIAVGTAAVQNGAIVNAMIGTTAIDDAKIANLSAAKLTAGDGTIGGDLKSSGFVAGSDGWIVRPNGTAEFGFAHIRGTLLASQVAADFITATMIDARGLSIKDASGNVILSAGSAIDWSKLGGAATNLSGLGYTGALNATAGATIGVNLGGQITSSNASTFIADAAISTAQIGELDAVKIKARSIKTENIEIGAATANASFGATGYDDINPDNVIGTYTRYSSEFVLNNLVENSQILVVGQAKLRIEGRVASSVNHLMYLARVERCFSFDGGATWRPYPEYFPSYIPVFITPYVNSYGDTKNFNCIVPLFDSFKNTYILWFGLPSAVKFRITVMYKFTSGPNSTTALNPNVDAAAGNYTTDGYGAFASAYEFRV